jgi:hypothetical protein
MAHLSLRFEGIMPADRTCDPYDVNVVFGRGIMMTVILKGRPSWSPLHRKAPPAAPGGVVRRLSACRIGLEYR